VTSDKTPRKRRRLSFGLRTMFFVMTLICIGLGIFASRAARTHRSISKLESVKAGIYYDYQYDSAGQRTDDAPSPAPSWLRGTIAEEFYRKTQTVDLAYGWNRQTRESKVTNDDLVLFENLPGIEILELGNNPAVTDAGLVHLAGLSKLKTLYLYETGVVGPGLRHLVSLKNIEAFGFMNMPLTGEGFEHLHKLPKLRWLNLGNTKINDAALTHIAKTQTLETLVLSRTDITDLGLEHLKSLSSLQTLSLDGTDVTAEGVARLEEALPNCKITPSSKMLAEQPQDVDLWPDDHQPSREELLTKLDSIGIDYDVTVDETRPGKPIVGFRMFRSNMSDKSLLRLLAEMPELERLNLRDVPVGDTFAAGLPQFKRLTFLAADGSRITDKGLPYLAQLLELRDLTLRRTRITDAGIMQLKALPKIEYMLVGESRTTSLGRHKLQQTMPNCNVGH